MFVNMKSAESAVGPAVVRPSMAHSRASVPVTGL